MLAAELEVDRLELELKLEEADVEVADEDDPAVDGSGAEAPEAEDKEDPTLVLVPPL